MPIDRRLTVWLGSLAALAVFNVGLWLWMARSASLRTPYAETQLLLSGVYVGVCGFRSLFPRVDLERVCLWDTWLSAIVLGRTAATIAELCFALQCGLFVQRLAEITGMPMAGGGGADIRAAGARRRAGCWYAVLSLNHIGHAIEESLWALIMLILSVAFGAAALRRHGPLAWMLLAGCVVYGSRRRVDAGVRRDGLRPSLADAGPRRAAAARDGIAGQPASPAADAGVGGLAGGSAVDDPLFQHRRLDEPGDGAPGMTDGTAAALGHRLPGQG